MVVPTTGQTSAVMMQGGKHGENDSLAVRVFLGDSSVEEEETKKDV